MNNNNTNLDHFANTENHCNHHHSHNNPSPVAATVTRLDSVSESESDSDATGVVIDGVVSCCDDIGNGSLFAAAAVVDCKMNSTNLSPPFPNSRNASGDATDTTFSPSSPSSSSSKEFIASPPIPVSPPHNSDVSNDNDNQDTTLLREQKDDEDKIHDDDDNDDDILSLSSSIKSSIRRRRRAGAVVRFSTEALVVPDEKKKKKMLLSFKHWNKIKNKYTKRNEDDNNISSSSPSSSLSQLWYTTRELKYMKHSIIFAIRSQECGYVPYHTTNASQQQQEDEEQDDSDDDDDYVLLCSSLDRYSTRNSKRRKSVIKQMIQTCNAIREYERATNTNQEEMLSQLLHRQSHPMVHEANQIASRIAASNKAIIRPCK